MKISLSDIDTEEGLDPLCRILSEETTVECKKNERYLRFIVPRPLIHTDRDA